MVMTTAGQSCSQANWQRGAPSSKIHASTEVAEYSAYARSQHFGLDTVETLS